MNPDKELIFSIAAKRLETTMIGALSRFENVFGYLWGQHKPHNEDLTDQEMHFDNMWQDVRNNILNHGNKQIRSLENDLDKQLSTGPKITYNYKFNIKE
jgi:hypothetical protein